MGYDLTDLKLLLLIAEQGSLTKAAQEMNLSLSSISARLAKLELSLGTKLFLRHNRGLIPSPAGKVALQHVHKIFSILREMEKASCG